MCLLELFWEIVGGWWAVEMKCTCLGGFLLGGLNAKKWGNIEKRISL